MMKITVSCWKFVWKWKVGGEVRESDVKWSGVELSEVKWKEMKRSDEIG